MINHVNAKVEMQPTLVNLTGTEDAQWMRVLKEACEGQWGNDLFLLADAQVALENDERRHVIIVYKEPIWQIADELRRHTPPAEAVVKWQDFAERIIWMHERFWDRMTVAILPSTLHDVRQLAQHVGDATGLQFADVKKFTASSRHEMPGAGVKDNSLTVAGMQLLTLPRARDVLEQVETITLPALQKPHVPDVIAEFLHSQESLLRDSGAAEGLRVETRRQKKELASAKQESDMLIEQLHRTQEELEVYVLQQRKLNEKIDGLRRGRDYRKTKIGELERHAQEQKEKIEALRRGRDYRRDKVASLQSEMRHKDAKIEWLRSVRDQHRRSARSLRADRRQQEMETKDLEARLADLEKQLKAIESSRSWRYTRVFRKIKTGK